LPVEYIKELSELKTKFRRFPTVEARAIIEQELQAKIESLFRSFDESVVGRRKLRASLIKRFCKPGRS